MDYIDKQYVSAWVDSQDKFYPTWGHLEARAKLAGTFGMWPAVWMLSQTTCVWWGTEFDIGEYVGRAPNFIIQQVIYYSQQVCASNGGMRAGTGASSTQNYNFYDDYHTFGMTRQEDLLTWWLDGVNMGSRTASDTGGWMDPTPHFWIFNAAVGGNYPQDPKPDNPWPVFTYVDYVRTWVYRTSCSDNGANVCSGHGCCNQTSILCQCDAGWAGTNCEYDMTSYSNAFAPPPSPEYSPVTNVYVNGWTNGQAMYNGNNVIINNLLTLQITNSGCPTSCAGVQFSAGAWNSARYFPYGTFSARVKGTNIPGTSVSVGASGQDSSSLEQIMMVQLGTNTRQIRIESWHTGYYYIQSLVNVTFDASADYHTYSFVWSPTALVFYIDGTIVKTTNVVIPSGLLALGIYFTVDPATASQFSYSSPITTTATQANWQSSTTLQTRFGTSCDVDECAYVPGPCDTNAKCANTLGSFTCTCNAGYTGNGATCTDVNECAAGGSNNCSPNGICTNTPGSFTCACKTGFTGNGVTCTDINECASSTTNNCNANAACTNTPGSFTCTCNSGYTGNGVTCTDINECQTGANNCSPNGICTNTIGSFTCACKSGYTGNGVTCTDINECASSSTNNCDVNAACTNTPGSFTCACNSGYTGNGLTCTDINECQTGANNCSPNGICTNTPGSFTCACKSGYSGNGVTCTDINECASSSANNCNGNATCTNTPGSFTCACNAGFTGNGVTCTDINECASGGSNNCSVNAICTNTPGSFTCACKSGYSGNGVTCTDINECASSTTNNCNVNAVCTNTQGSFTCTCNAGYTGNGVTCSDFNECASSTTNNCSANATCTNTPSSFTCTCNQGYSGNGVVCTDINECTTGNNCSAQATCTNTPGSYICTCIKGYSGNGITCTDTNECASSTLNNCNANAVCTNTIGSYTCACKTGFTGNGVNCTDINECGAGFANNCSLQAQCTNTPGSYICTCNPGWTGNGYSCNDTDECATTNNCSVYAVCDNTIGSYTCTCKAGYTGNGTFCQDINECSKGFANNCSDYATCKNTVGGYTCTCASGFTGDGYNCTDINECLSNPCLAGVCNNSLGGYSCDCQPGYSSKSNNGTLCVDLDECALKTDSCETFSTCNNTIGSYFCVAAPLFIDGSKFIWSNSTIEIYWEVPTFGVEVENLTYVIQMAPDNVNWATIYNGDQTNFTLDKLQSETTYYFRISYNISNILSSFSPTANYTTNGVPTLPPASSQLMFPRYSSNYIVVQIPPSRPSGPTIQSYLLSMYADPTPTQPPTPKPTPSPSPSPSPSPLPSPSPSPNDTTPTPNPNSTLPTPDPNTTSPSPTPSVAPLAMVLASDTNETADNSTTGGNSTSTTGGLGGTTGTTGANGTDSDNGTEGGDKLKWTTVTINAATSSSYKFSGLNGNTQYHFEFQTSNLFGVSPMSDMSNFTTVPPFCGDQSCGLDESCLSCLLDCGACGSPPCPGSPECSNNGVCTQGVCVCNNQFAGPDCSQDRAKPVLHIVEVTNTSVRNTTNTTQPTPPPNANSTSNSTSAPTPPPDTNTTTNATLAPTQPPNTNATGNSTAKAKHQIRANNATDAPTSQPTFTPTPNPDNTTNTDSTDPTPLPYPSNATDTNSTRPPPKHSIMISAPQYIDKNGITQDPVDFTFAIKTIIERNQTGSVVKNITIPAQNFTLSNSSIVLADGSVVTTINYTLVILQNSTLTVLLSLYPQAESVSLGGKSITVPQYGIVCDVSIVNWPFEQVQNQLILTISSQLNPSITEVPVVTWNANSTANNLRWLNIQVLSTNLYATFQQSAILDDTTTNVLFTYLNSSDGSYDVSVTLPHFWENSEFGIVYAINQERVVADTSKSGSGGGSKWYTSVLFIALVAGIGGALVLAAIIVLIVLKTRQAQYAEGIELK